MKLFLPLMIALLVGIAIRTMAVVLEKLIEQPIANPAYLLGMILIFLGFLALSLYFNLELFAQKLTVRRWALLFLFIMLLQPLLLIPHLYFFSRNPYLSSLALSLMGLLAVLKCCNMAVLFYYALKHPPHPTKALAPLPKSISRTR